MKQVKDAIQAWTQIEEEANQNAVNSARIVHKMEIGQIVRQGDIYIHCVDAGHPHGGELKSRQLAIGTTQGSRHFAEEPSTVFAGMQRPAWCGERTFLGPLVKCGARFTITHPEHAHVDLPPGCYQITHQMDARTLERVKD